MIVNNRSSSDSYKQLDQKTKQMQPRGPGKLDLYEYTHNQIRYQPIQHNEDDNNEQQQFNRDRQQFQKNNEILNRMLNNINQLKQNQFNLDIYPQFITNCLYDNHSQKQIIGQNDGQFAHYIDILQKNNTSLKKQLYGWIFQFVKNNRLAEVLLIENKLLRKFINSKNKQIVKLIQYIDNNDNCCLNQLKEKFNQLKQQDGILTDHLSLLKLNGKQKKNQEIKLVQACNKIQQQKIHLIFQIEKGEDQEEHYSKKLLLLQENVDAALKRLRKLDQERQKLTKIKNMYLIDNHQIQQQLQLTQKQKQEIDRDLKTKRQNYQQQKLQLINDVDELNQKIKKMKQQSHAHEEQINKYEQGIDQDTNYGNALDKKISQIQQNIKGFQRQENQFKDVEIQHLANIDLINLDIEILKQELQQLDLQQQAKIEQHKASLKYLQNNKKQQQSQFIKQYQNKLRDNNRILGQQKIALGIKMKEVEKWSIKVHDKKQQIQDLKQDLNQIKQNQAQLANLTSQLKSNHN